LNSGSGSKARVEHADVDDPHQRELAPAGQRAGARGAADLEGVEEQAARGRAVDGVRVHDAGVAAAVAELDDPVSADGLDQVPCVHSSRA